MCPHLAATAEMPAFGPLVHQFGVTLENAERTEAAGPFYYHEEGEDYLEWAFPPFFARRYDERTDKLSWEVLWKVASYDRMGPEAKFTFMQFINVGGARSLNEEGDRRFTLFPVYFQNRSDNPDRDYTGVLPFYGTVRHRMFRDEINWVMFPIYVQSRKQDLVTDNYVFPFFHRRHGDSLNGWQLWPLMGREHKGVSWRTNVLGEVVEIGPHEKSFYLWPFVMNSHTAIGQPEEQRQRAVLPFYYLERSQSRDVTTYLWPLFPVIDDRGKDYRERGMPYPLIVVSQGPGKTGARFWPFYGQAHSETLRTRFILGPLYRSKELNSENLHRLRWNSCYFLYDSVDEDNTETGKGYRRRGFTPFFHYVKDWSGRESLQILAPLETTLPHSDTLRRSLSPLWALWRSEKNPAAGKSSQSFLWNLYRRDTTRDGRKGSLLFGLFRWEKGSAGRSLQFFYLPKLKLGPKDAPNVALEQAGASTP